MIPDRPAFRITIPGGYVRPLTIQENPYNEKKRMNGQAGFLCVVEIIIDTSPA
jgi:hypothetical protein